MRLKRGRRHGLLTAWGLERAMEWVLLDAVSNVIPEERLGRRRRRRLGEQDFGPNVRMLRLGGDGVVWLTRR
jgi:hypothetical protein